MLMNYPWENGGIDAAISPYIFYRNHPTLNKVSSHVAVS